MQLTLLSRHLGSGGKTVTAEAATDDALLPDDDEAATRTSGHY